MRGTRGPRSVASCVPIALGLACAPGAGAPPRGPAGRAAPAPVVDDSGAPPQDVDPRAPEWLFLVYMAGDNDLEAYVPEDLNELEAVGSGDGVQIYVQADRIPGHSREDGDWTGARRYQIVADADPRRVGSPVLEELGEVDMGSPDTLADFLAWGLDQAPEARVALILWNHGDGWSVAPADARHPTAIASDDTSGEHISVAEGELAAALQPAVDRRGPLELLGFDACSMAGWEVSLGVQGLAGTVVASQATVGWEGLVYDDALAWLREQPEAPAEALAARLAGGAVRLGGEPTFSAQRADGALEVAKALDALAAEVLDDPALEGPLWRARDRSRGTAVGEWEYYYLDLGGFADALIDGGGPLAGHGVALRGAHDRAVLHSAAAPPFAFAAGMNLFFDHHPMQVQLYGQGAGARWAHETRWDDLMDHLFLPR